MKKYYVYTLKDQGQPFYVGYGTGDRAYSHERYAKGEVELGYGRHRDYNPHKTRKIQKLLDEGRTVEYEFVADLDKPAAFQLEMELIKRYGRSFEGGLLTNIHPGGSGGNTYAGLSEEKKTTAKLKSRRAWESKSEDEIAAITERAKYSKRNRIDGTSNGGTVQTDKTKQRISASQLGLGNSMFGKPSPKRNMPATGGNAKGVRKASNKGKPMVKWEVTQMDLQGNVLNIWPSKSAAAKAMGLGVSTIHHFAESIEPQMGFLWSKSEKVHQPKVHTPKGRRVVSVYQMDLSGNILKEWPSIKAAALELNLHIGAISNAAANHHKGWTSGGFMWKKLG